MKKRRGDKKEKPEAEKSAYEMYHDQIAKDRKALQEKHERKSHFEVPRDSHGHKRRSSGGRDEFHSF